LKFSCAIIDDRAVSCLIGNIEAHFMHYRFTFSSTFSYFRSLNRAFLTYTGQLLITTLFHYLMVEILLLHHTLAWLVNTCVFGYLNFLLIRWIAFPPEYDKKYQLDAKDTECYAGIKTETLLSTLNKRT